MLKEEKNLNQSEITTDDDFKKISEEFEKENYSPLWSLTLPDELNQILSNLNDIAWKGLIDCIVCKPEDFDAKWDEMQQKLKTVGLKKADQEMTALLREEISRRE